MRAVSMKYMLLLLAQVALWNYCNFSQYLIVVFLPAMILCLPMEYGSVRLMVIAFVTGLAADFLVTGQLGVTSFALVPVALLRRPVVMLVFGSELLVRGEKLSFHRQSWTKILLAIALLTALFLLFWIWADSAGVMPLWFNAVRFAASLALGTAVSMPVASIMLEETEAQWK